MFSGFCWSRRGYPYPFSLWGQQLTDLFPIPNHPINSVASMTRMVHYKWRVAGRPKSCISSSKSSFSVNRSICSSLNISVTPLFASHFTNLQLNDLSGLLLSSRNEWISRLSPVTLGVTAP